MQSWPSVRQEAQGQEDDGRGIIKFNGGFVTAMLLPPRVLRTSRFIATDEARAKIFLVRPSAHDGLQFGQGPILGSRFRPAVRSAHIAENSTTTRRLRASYRRQSDALSR